MDIYKKASKQKLRFSSPQGLLSIEQLWDLPIQQLDEMTVIAEVEKDSTGSKKSFINRVDTKENTVATLKFEILKDVLETKVRISETASKALETKAKNQKIYSLIEQKKEGKMAEMSIEELEKLLVD